MISAVFVEICKSNFLWFSNDGHFVEFPQHFQNHLGGMIFLFWIINFKAYFCDLI